MHILSRRHFSFFKTAEDQQVPVVSRSHFTTTAGTRDRIPFFQECLQGLKTFTRTHGLATGAFVKHNAQGLLHRGTQGFTSLLSEVPRFENCCGWMEDASGL